MKLPLIGLELLEFLFPIVFSSSVAWQLCYRDRNLYKPCFDVFTESMSGVPSCFAISPQLVRYISVHLVLRESVVREVEIIPFRS